jgi:lysozyme family protein
MDKRILVTSIAVTFTAVAMPIRPALAADKPQQNQQPRQQQGGGDGGKRPDPNSGGAPPDDMLTTRIPIINHTINMFEGTTYTNAKHDKGGATKFGITIATLKAYRQEKVSENDVKNLTRDEAVDIYTEQYWNKVKADELPECLRCVVFDMAVNHGPANAGKILQRALNKVELGDGDDPIKVDGKIGPITVAEAQKKVRALGAKPVLKLVVDERKEFYEDIIERDETQEKWRKGWMKRADWFMENAHRLIPPDAPKPDDNQPNNKPAPKKIAATRIPAGGKS